MSPYRKPSRPVCKHNHIAIKRVRIYGDAILHLGRNYEEWHVCACCGEYATIFMRFRAWLKKEITNGHLSVLQF